MKMVFSISSFTCNLLSTSSEEQLLPLNSTRKVLAETQPGSLCHAEITCCISHAHQRTHPWGLRDGLPWTGLGHIPTPVAKGRPGDQVHVNCVAWEAMGMGLGWQKQQMLAILVTLGILIFHLFFHVCIQSYYLIFI